METKMPENPEFRPAEESTSAFMFGEQPEGFDPYDELDGEDFEISPKTVEDKVDITKPIELDPDEEEELTNAGMMQSHAIDTAYSAMQKPEPYPEQVKKEENKRELELSKELLKKDKIPFSSRAMDAVTKGLNAALGRGKDLNNQ